MQPKTASQTRAHARPDPSNKQHDHPNRGAPADLTRLPRPPGHDRATRPDSQLADTAQPVECPIPPPGPEELGQATGGFRLPALAQEAHHRVAQTRSCRAHPEWAPRSERHDRTARFAPDPRHTESPSCALAWCKYALNASRSFPASCEGSPNASKSGSRSREGRGRASRKSKGRSF